MNRGRYIGNGPCLTHGKVYNYVLSMTGEKLVVLDNGRQIEFVRDDLLVDEIDFRSMQIDKIII